MCAERVRDELLGDGGALGDVEREPARHAVALDLRHQEVLVLHIIPHLHAMTSADPLSCTPDLYCTYRGRTELEPVHIRGEQS